MRFPVLLLFLAALPACLRVDPRVNPATISEDAARLERLLASRSALALLSPDAPAAIARSLTEAASRGDTAALDRAALALLVDRSLAPLGDAYAAAMPAARVPDLGVLPFEVRKSARGYVALREGGDELLDPERPILAGIDGTPVGEWIEATALLGAAPSGPGGVSRSLKELRHLGLLRRERGMAYSPVSTVLLTDASGANAKPLTLRLGSRAAEPLIWPRAPSRIIDHRGSLVGYLRIPKMGQGGRGHRNLIENLDTVRDTSALVVDLRGNAGRGISSVRVLLPLLSRPAPFTEVAAVVWVREDAGYSEVEFEKRSLFAASSPRLTGEERGVIERAARSFRPEARIPPEEKGEWRYFLSSPGRQGGKAYSYEGPVAVLVDSGCLDTCELLVAAVKGRPGVTLVGSPSGGGGYGLPSSSRLPATGVGVAVSSVLSFSARGKLLTGRSVKPDVAVEPEPLDFTGRSDAALDRALAILYSSARGGRSASIAPSLSRASKPSSPSVNTKE